ncbi:MAG: 50S ribosomal protein L9, large subunit ribosomal protein L9 [Candidatus Peregrinibacteria bacterium GW2011_GWE2_39_6]|nr:MAG: 50S ribosomal protein L9, large subunit ribosomal protein L9 [Candidatus Peregrinibacteria bacterium GW2011_GWE2_39_6]
MQIVLTQHVQSLGKKGDIKNVKKGYFRNFLSPRGLALRMTEKLLKQLEIQQGKAIKRKEESIAKAEEYKEMIESLKLTFAKKVTSKGKLYAAVTDKQIQEALEKQLKIELEKGAVEIDEHLKSTGEYEVKVVLTDHTSAILKVSIVAEK